MDHKQVRLISIGIGVVVAIVLIIVGFGLFQNVFTRAEDQAPRDVVVTDKTNNSAKISWVTGIENQGVIEYGTSLNQLNFFAPEAQKTKSHSVDLTLLSPNTTYYYVIRIGDKKYDNGGLAWTFTTNSSAGTAGGVNPTTAVVIQPTAPPVVAASPTPISSVEIPNRTQQQSSLPQSGCTETDCAKIQEKIGKGCTAQDYAKCIVKVTKTP